MEINSVKHYKKSSCAITFSVLSSMESALFRRSISSLPKICGFCLLTVIGSEKCRMIHANSASNFDLVFTFK